MTPDTLLEIPPAADLLRDPGAAFDAALEARRPALAPSPAIAEAGESGRKPKKPAGPLLVLSARRPYDAAGLIDVLDVGRWDASSDTIYLKPIVQTGSSPGEWAGSVVYGRFMPPAAGTYRISATFYGYQITTRLTGPFGVVVGSSFDNTPVTVTAQVAVAAGAASWFNLSCTGLYLGFLQRIDVEQA